MRSAGNFHPEWGYLAPAPSFLHTARIVAVSTAIGAIASAAVVLSLVEPATSPADTSVAGRALVMSAQAATPSAIPLADAAPVALVTAPANAPAAQAEVPAPTQPPATATATVQAKVDTAPENGVAPAAVDPNGPGAIEASTASTPQAPASVAALAEAPPAAAPGQVPEEAAAMPPPPKKRIRTSRSAWYRPFETVPPRRSASNHRGLGPTLRRLFSARSSYYPYRGL